MPLYLVLLAVPRAAGFFAAVARVRSSLAFATHQFFQDQGFRYLQTPLITASDCEGAGEMFHIRNAPPSFLPSRSCVFYIRKVPI